MNHLVDIMNIDDYTRALNEGLIQAHPSGDGLLIHNYTQKAMHHPGAWDNEAVRICRGLITTEGGDIVARPWAKFFNHDQKEAGVLDMNAPVEVTDKMDGSLGIIYRTKDGGVAVATRGSFTSDQAIHATKVLREKYPDLQLHYRWLTPMVEIIYPENRIVCDYGDLDDLVLLGGVSDAGIYYGPADTSTLIGWEGPITKAFGYPTLRDALAAEPRDGAEGLCVRFLGEDRIVKVKQEDYIALHRIVTGLSERTVWEHMMAGDGFELLLERLPDEFHDWVLDVYSTLLDAARKSMDAAYDLHDKIAKELGGERTRKEFALRAQEEGEWASLLFAIEDGKFIWRTVLKGFKPRGESHAIIRTEDVA